MHELHQGALPIRVVTGAQRVDVKRAFTCLFKQQGWVKTAALGALFMFIPMVGPIAFQGYTTRLLKHLVVTGDDMNLPRLDGFGELMGIGMMPFVLGMIWTFPLIFVVYFLMGLAGLAVVVVMMGSAALLNAMGLSPDVTAAVTMALTILASIVAVILLYVAVILLSYPLQAINTFVELTGKLEYAWKFSFLRDYLRLLGPEYRRGFVGMMIGNMLLVTLVLLVSLITLGIGYLPALMALVVCMGVAGSHLRSQLYRIYLARGGEPVPMDPRM